MSMAKRVRMEFEVEQKFPIADPSDVRGALESLGAVFSSPICQQDAYYAHPCRDFAKTDEAIRLRRVGDSNRITYKGPKIDQATKTRREIELPLDSGEDSAAKWDSLLQALGFKPAAVVRKTRRRGRLMWQESEVELALDHVDRIGDFLELELAADEQSLEMAQQKILALGRELGLGKAERRSYLEMLQAADSTDES